MRELVNQEPSETAAGPFLGMPLRVGQRWMIASIVAAGTVLSMLMYLSLRWQEDRHIRESFTDRSVDRMKSIAHQFETGMTQLRSVAAAVELYTRMKPNRFRAITDNFLSEDSRMHAMSWNARVPAGELARHIANAKKKHPDYQLHQFGPHGELEPVSLETHDQLDPRDRYIVELIEPLESNRSVLGLDISSEPVRLAALEHAVRVGYPIATGRIKLVQGTGSQYGVLLITPVPKKSATPSSEEAPNDVAGVVVGVYHVGDAVEAALKNLAIAGIDVRLIDDSAPPQEQLLHLHSSRERHLSLASADDKTLDGKKIVETARLDFGGRKWSLHCTPTDDYFSSRRTWFPVTVLGGGLSVTFLIAAYFVLQHRLTDQLRREILIRAEAERNLAERERTLAHVSRLSTMGEMVAGIAHEITQPLAAISNFAAATLNTLKKNYQTDSATMQEWLGQITAQAIRCGEIIRRLRRFVTRDQQEAQFVDLNRVIIDSIALIAYDKRHFTSCILCQLPEDSPHVHASEVQLQQVIVNLLRNACDATAESAEPSISVSLVLRNDCVRLTVADNGPGIDNAHREKVFDTFYTTKSDGMGMGLAISKSIIEAHHGRLWQDCETPHGAMFHVDLPFDSAIGSAA